MLLLEKASFESFLRDFMDPTMDNTKHILNYLMPIIDRVNPEVHDFMQRYANVPLEPLGTPLPVSQGCFYQHTSLSPQWFLVSTAVPQLMVTPQSRVALISEQAQTCAACLEGFYMVPPSAHLSAVCIGRAGDLGTALYKGYNCFM